MSYLDAAANNTGSAADAAAERKTPSTTTLGPNSFSNPLRWNHWVQCTSLCDSFRLNSAARSQPAKAAFCFSAFQFCCIALIQFCCIVTVLFLFTARIECHSIFHSYLISYTPLLFSKGENNNNNHLLAQCQDFNYITSTLFLVTTLLHVL